MCARTTLRCTMAKAHAVCATMLIAVLLIMAFFYSTNFNVFLSVDRNKGKGGPPVIAFADYYYPMLYSVSYRSVSQRIVWRECFDGWRRSTVCCGSERVLLIVAYRPLCHIERIGTVFPFPKQLTFSLLRFCFNEPLHNDTASFVVFSI